MSQPQTELSRDLSLFDVTMIGVGAMIGAGIFVLTGIAAGAAGPALILAFALNGIITLFTAMVYAELGSAIPEAGGGYLWVREGLPGPNAFLAGWMSWFAHAVAGSLYALGFGSYLVLVFSELGMLPASLDTPWFHKVVAVAIILIFVAINFRGVSETGTAGNIVTVLKVVVLGIFIVSGLWAIYRHPIYLDKFQNFAPNGWIGILSAMGLTFIAFEGYEIIVQTGEEVKNPRQTLPRAVFLSLAIVIPIYILVAFVAVGAVNPDTNIPTYQWLAEHAELGVAEAARQFMPLGTVLLLIGGLLSTMSALNATTFSSTRVSFAMGRDRNLPNLFAAIHPRTRTPYQALMVSGALITFMAVAIPIEDVAAAADIMFLLLFLQVNLAAITLRNKYGDRLHYGYLTPFFPVIPILGVVTELFLAVFMFHYSAVAWYFTGAWILIGLGIYYFYARKRLEARTRTPIMRAERRTVPQPEKGYAVLVPIANPDSLPVLLRPAIQAARENDGYVLLLHVVTVPPQLPLSAGRRYVEQSRALTDQALQMVEDEGVEGEVLVRIAHQPAQAIIQTARERQVRLLIMGWRGRSRNPNTYIGSNIDTIIHQVNCQVMVVQQTPPPPFNRFLVPIADPLQTPYALAAVHLLADPRFSEVDVVHVFAPGTEQARREALLGEIQAQIDAYRQAHPGLDDMRISLRGVEGSNVLDVLVQAARKHDCVILGATRESWLRQQIFGNLPARLAGQLETSVVLVRPQTGPVGFGLARLLHYVRGGYRIIEPTSAQELQEQGILAPQPIHNPEDLHTAVNKKSLLGAGLLGLLSVLLMYWGDGSGFTWLGVGIYLLCLFWFTWSSVRGILAAT
ncbi:amino acid permease [Litorilinea aerophila]|uniref:Amino acid permease n=1 Tax=Litorilinea aerophila TaxID=1204385 RepID=A0A540VKI5_9CHLR|nr:amino acid permease [Litorilinea aerophila]MCC9075363.1 amino acid permease [Litorilinea aerophila]